MQLIAILAALVAANIGVVYYGSDIMDEQNPDAPQGIVEVQEEAPAEAPTAVPVPATAPKAN
ncbi:MAG: hypothetical protein COA99_00270 [Moraxellaceae bacterium]|nr:MAG: hypothetical protein COA99_00270 [Moraxellaceae bacterium]